MKRPRFLNPLAVHMPVGAVASILHRLSGVLLFLLLPPAAWLFAVSLQDPGRHAEVMALLGSPWMKLPGGLFLWALLHHLFAGIRFLLLDAGHGIERTAARRMAWLATLAAPLLTLLVLFLEGLP